jgi:hypothetical protein
MASQPYASPEAPSPAPPPPTYARAARRLAAALVVTQAGLIVLGIAFRALVYPRLGVAPGAPYGIGDILELLIGAALALASLVALAAAVVLAAVRSLRDGRAIAALWMSGVIAWPLTLALRALL